MGKIPIEYFQSLERHFGSEITDRVKRGLEEPPSISVRLNPAKPSKRFNQHNKAPWCEESRLLDERPNFAQDPLFHAGAYYVQDSSSMILSEVLKQLNPGIDPILALDLCAAPGGKSIILSDYLRDRGFLIANEVDSKRNAVLTENLLKWGSSHQAITQLSSQKLGELESVFDLVVIDAPCSGEGMFRKDTFAIEQWSESLIQQCVNTQEEILDDILPALALEGHIVYSTCTMNVKENEHQIMRMLQNGFELALPDLSVYTDKIIPAVIDGLCLGYYLLPGISTGEGLFISVLKKTEGTKASIKKRGLKLPEFDHEKLDSFGKSEYTHQWTKHDEIYGVEDQYKLLQRLPDRMAFKSTGVPAYVQKGKDIIPLHGIAMSAASRPDVNLDTAQALSYLRRESLQLKVDLPKKWNLVGYEGISLGWVKRIPGRLNNYYPTHLRLRH